MMNTKPKASLYLIPAPLGETGFDTVFPSYNMEIINSIDYYIVEELRSARRLLRKMDIRKPIDQLTFFVYNEHSRNVREDDYLQPLLEGNPMGLLSEAGVPCIADPGNRIVARAHQLGIQVNPLTGPSSLLLALMASGLNGQQFAFQGYLPVERPLREEQLRFYESIMKKTGQTQIFIETPYRNNHFLESVLTVCAPETRLCIAANLTTGDEYILTQSVAKWKKSKPDLHKKPAIFLLGR